MPFLQETLHLGIFEMFSCQNAHADIIDIVKIYVNHSTDFFFSEYTSESKG